MRIRLKSVHRKRWQKGKSCVSNPSITKHRDAASEKMENVQSISDSIDQFNRFSICGDSEENFSDTGSCRSLFSTFTTALKPADNLFKDSSDDAFYKEIQTIVTAAKNVLDETSTPDTNVGYLFVLSQMAESDKVNEKSLTAIFYLISLIIKKIDGVVLRKSYSKLNVLFVKFIELFYSSDRHFLQIALINSYGYLLMAQDVSVYSNKELLHPILSFCTCIKPTLRKKSLKLVDMILSRSEITNSIPNHPACKHIYKFLKGSSFFDGSGLLDPANLAPYMSLIYVCLTYLPTDYQIEIFGAFKRFISCCKDVIILRSFSIIENYLLAQKDKHIDADVSESILDLTKNVCELRNDYNSQTQLKAEQLIALVIRQLGAHRVLRVFPLCIVGNELPNDLERAWIVPLLRNYSSHTLLQCWIDTFLPLIKDFSSRFVLNSSRYSAATVSTYQALVTQFWSILPSFCRHCMDYSNAFTASFAKYLLSQLVEHQNTYGVYILHCFMVISKLDIKNSTRTIANYCKNILPTLFNIYTSNKTDGISSSLIQAIGNLMSLADADLVERFFNNAFQKLRAQQSSDELKFRLFDLLREFVQHLNDDCMLQILNFSIDCMNSTNDTIQKKSYNILSVISSSEMCESIFTSNYERIVNTLATSLNNSSPAARTPRLRCLLGVLKGLPSSQLKLLNTFFPEIVLSMKYAGVKGRKISVLCLKECCTLYIRYTNKDKADCVTDIFQTVLAGLTSSNEMIVSTLISIEYLILHFEGCLYFTLIDQLFNAFFLMLSLDNSLFYKKCLSCIKTFVVVLTSVQLEPILPELVKTLTSFNRRTKLKHRFEIKLIFFKLAKRFTFESLLELMPEDQKKMVLNLKKSLDRAQRKRLGLINSDSSSQTMSSLSSITSRTRGRTIQEILHELDSDDDDNSFASKSVRSTFSKVSTRSFRKKSNSIWLKEDEDNPLDLQQLSSGSVLDTDANRAVQIKSKKLPNFPVSASGKFFISDKIDDDDYSFHKSLPSYSRGKQGVCENDSDDGEMDEEHLITGRFSAIARKRRFSDTKSSTTKKSRKSSRVSKSSYGTEYKAKKAKGDIKLKGKPDPFAYLPFNRQSLNKRKSAKLKGQFRGIVKSSQKGARKGMLLNKRK